MVAEGMDLKPGRPSPRIELETRRLELRTRRMQFVIGALRERADGYERRGTVPRPLHEAIAGFTADLRSDRDRLKKLRRTTPEAE